MKLKKLELRNVPFSKLLKQKLPTLAANLFHTTSSTVRHVYQFRHQGIIKLNNKT